MKAIALVLLLVLAASVVQTVVYFPQLPDPMASHFGAGGQADGWMSRQSFFVLNYALIGLMLLTLGGMTLVLPRFPDSLVNISHKEYWLAPERRAQTFAILQRSLGWILVLTLAFLVFVDQLVIEVNLSQSPILPPVFLWSLALYLVAVFGATFWLWRRFRKVPTTPAGFR